MARLTLLAVPALLTRVDLEAARSSSETGAAHPEAGFRRTSGTANKVSRATRRATPVTPKKVTVLRCGSTRMLAPETRDGRASSGSCQFTSSRPHRRRA